MTSITVDSRTFHYYYQGITLPGNLGAGSLLTQVSPPTGSPWKYDYVWDSPNYLLDLTRITFPSGGTISYAYSDRYFDTGVVDVKFRVVSQRTTGGRDVPGGTWYYTYYSGGSGGNITNIDGPNGLSEVHKFFAWGDRCPTSPSNCGSIWAIGLPKSREILLNNSAIQSESYSWVKGPQISLDQVANGSWLPGGPFIYDTVYTAFLSSKSVTRDGKTYTTNYSDFDFYGNPGTISESGDTTRSMSISYWKNTAKNIVKNKPSSETLSGGLPDSFTTSYSYDNNGNVTQISKYGVTTDYTYYSNGNLNTVRDTNQNTTTFEWSNGNISKITNPVYIIYRTINGSGTIASETNGRGKTTYYYYDGKLQLTSINPPDGNTTYFTYASDNSYKKSTRDGFYTYSYFDGFGRPSGSNDSRGVTTDIVYKSYGPRDNASSNIGDTIKYDYFGRPTEVVHKDGNAITYAYSGSDVTITDEADKKTYLYYDAFGSPDEKMLTSVKDALNNTTSYSRNILGSLTGITQGSVARTFGYSTKNFLTSESGPETGSMFQHTWHSGYNPVWSRHMKCS